MANHGTRPENKDTSQGLVLAMIAYLIWGFLPFYMKLVAHIPAPEVVVHRVLWSVPIAGAVLLILRRTGDLIAALRSPRTLAMGCVTAALITVNWGIYVWSIANDRALDAALGYYINPLFSVALGALLLTCTASAAEPEFHTSLARWDAPRVFRAGPPVAELANRLHLIEVPGGATPAGELMASPEGAARLWVRNPDSSQAGSWGAALILRPDAERVRSPAPGAGLVYRGRSHARALRSQARPAPRRGDGACRATPFADRRFRRGVRPVKRTGSLAGPAPPPQRLAMNWRADHQGARRGARR